MASSEGPSPSVLQARHPAPVPLAVPDPAQRHPPSNSLVNLLVMIILHSLNVDLVQTAVFFSERLHALIPSSELAVWLLSLSLLRSGDHQATLHLLRCTPIFIPNPPRPSHHNQADRKGKAKSVDDDPFNFYPSFRPKDEMDDSLWDWNHHEATKGIQRTANLASTRCAAVYSKACSLANRPKEGLQVYLRAIQEFGEVTPKQDALLNPASHPLQSSSSTHTLLAQLAHRAHEYDKSQELYRHALHSKPDGHLCWEAFEGLCQIVDPETDVDVEEIFGKVNPDHFLEGFMELDDEYICGTCYASTDHRRPASVPIASNAPVNPKPPPLAPKDAFRILGHNGRHHRKFVMLDHSFGDSSHSSSFAANSFEHAPYPLRDKNPAARSGPPAANHLRLGANGALFTPSAHGPLVAPQRLFSFTPGDPSRRESNLDNLPLSSTPNLQREFELQTPPISMVPLPTSLIPADDFATPCHDVIDSLPPPTQNGKACVNIKRTRSQTQALEANASQNLPAKAFSGTSHKPTLVEQTTTPDTRTPDPQLARLNSVHPLAKNEVISNGRLLKVAPREAKRVRSSGNLPRASFVPPPFKEAIAYSSQRQASRFRQSKIEAINWVVNVLKKFAYAYLGLSRFRCEEVLNELLTLPHEQKRSWRVYCLIGRARFELLDYKSAEMAFKKARECFPHLVAHMDIYSTLLWHLRKTTTLSYLSQELQLINPRATETWIATGNLFSRLEDHPNALKCFQRSTQLSSSNEYAYTLSGHECLMLEEYSRSLVFFRESLRRNSAKNYNAYFGLGECYFKQEKFRLAKYFFEKAFEVNRRNPLILCAIGKVLERLAKPREALKVYNHALDIGTHCVASVKFSRAKLLFGLRQYETAKKDLVELSQIVPTEFNVRFLLGKVYGILGDSKRCIRELTYAQDLQPKSSNQIRKILSELNQQRSSTDTPQLGQTKHYSTAKAGASRESSTNFMELDGAGNISSSTNLTNYSL